MTFEENLADFSKSIKTKKRAITTEETTKISLVLPFLRLLGYDVENPDELKAEYSADVGVKKSEKIDLAVCIDGEVKMLIECKPANVKLNSNHLNQLFRYYSVSDVKIAVLTNGVVYKFFTDFENPGRMDDEAFLEVDLKTLTQSKIEYLKMFKKDSFSEENILKHVEDLKYRQAVHDVLLEEIASPGEEISYLIAKKVYSGQLTKAKRKYFYKIIKEEIMDVFENDYETDPSEIITTEEEKEAFYIIRAVLSEITDVGRITLRDRISYCGVLLDDNNRYPVCRLHFNDLDNLAVEFFDSFTKDKTGSKIGEKIALNNVSDIYRYRERLVETVRTYKIKK